MNCNYKISNYIKKNRFPRKLKKKLKKMQKQICLKNGFKIISLNAIIIRKNKKI